MWGLNGFSSLEIKYCSNPKKVWKTLRLLTSHIHRCEGSKSLPTISLISSAVGGFSFKVTFNNIVLNLVELVSFSRQLQMLRNFEYQERTAYGFGSFHIFRSKIRRTHPNISTLTLALGEFSFKVTIINIVFNLVELVSFSRKLQMDRNFKTAPTRPSLTLAVGWFSFKVMPISIVLKEKADGERGNQTPPIGRDAYG